MFDKLARLTPEEEAQLSLLEKSLLDLQANDAEKLTRALTLRAGRVKALPGHLTAIEAALSVLLLSALSVAIIVRSEIPRSARRSTQIRRQESFPSTRSK